MVAAKLDGRAALITLVVFVLAVVSVSKYNLAGVVALAALPVFVIVVYAVDIRPLIKKLLFISPFMLVAAGANVFIDKHPVSFADSIVLRGGVVSAAVIALKGYVTVMATLILVELVSFDRLCRSMEKMRIPSVFVTQLSLLYRYFQLLKSEALSMARARDLRACNGRGKGISVTASLIGSLFLRSTFRAGRVHDAMIARGFVGGAFAVSSGSEHFKASDLLSITFFIAAIISIRLYF